MARIHPEIYFFGAGVAEGRAEMRNLLGGKGANLAEMASLKLPVPPGFTISTRVCNYFYDHGHKYPKGLTEGVAKSVARVEKALGRKFGDAKNPLLVSVRSGARVSMPGMMDTVLNLGLTDETVKGLEEVSGNPRFAWDSYRRFCQMYGDVVLKLKPENKNDPDPFEEIIDHKKAARGVKNDTDLTVDDLRELVGEFRALIRARVGRDIPQDPREQLWEAIGAVFGSWHNDRAITYRKFNNIPGDWGTAVTVQSMVFGNLGDDCATGVAFTRDPSTGEKGIYGEFLPNAQGEDVVAGIRTPLQISLKAGREWAARAGNQRGRAQGAILDARGKLPRGLQGAAQDRGAARKAFPRHAGHGIHHRARSPLHAADAHRQAHGGGRGAYRGRDGRREADRSQDRADARRAGAARTVAASAARPVEQKTRDRARTAGVAGRGLRRSGVLGRRSGRGRGSRPQVILVRLETSPEDIHGMQVAEGILTARGGMTSHAAVVARGMGKCCVAGCSALEIDYGAGTLTADGAVVRRGEYITLDGSAGEVIAGRVPTVEPEMSSYFKKFLTWADQERKLGVRANADTPNDAKIARDFGAEGIGLCRTEHMFFGPERIEAVREMIMAENAQQRGRALEKILPMQREDFVGILSEMAGLPVTIRLLDPPLHEFLPNEDNEIRELAAKIGTSSSI